MWQTLVVLRSFCRRLLA